MALWPHVPFTPVRRYYPYFKLYHELYGNNSCATNVEVERILNSYEGPDAGLGIPARWIVEEMRLLVGTPGPRRKT